MSLANLIAADVANVLFDENDFASSILRYIGGDEGNATTITAISFDGGVQTNDSRGRGYDHIATLVLISTVAINVGDAIKYGTERYEVKAVGDPELGIRTVLLTRYQPEVKGGKVFRNGDL